MKQKSRMSKKICLVIFFLIIQYLIPLSSSAGTEDAYEADNNSGMAKKIIINDTVSQLHNFHQENDEDWIKFIAFAGNSYTIKAINKSGTSDLVVELYDANNMSEPIQIQDTIGNETADEILDFNNCPHDGIYYAKVRLYDSSSFVADAEYELSIHLQIGPEPGTVQGRVKDSVSGKFIADAMVTSNKKRADFSSVDDGYYRMMDHPSGDLILMADAEGYEPCSSSEFLPEGGVLDKDILIIPFDLSGALFMLKILTGYVPSDPFCWKDTVSGDGKIALDDVIYILQKTAKLR